MKKLLLVITMILWAVSAHAASWYVDGSVPTSGNGHSWATAWKNISNITRLSAGDTVYISGGSSGSSQTYIMSGSWIPTGGKAGNPITYKIGQDSLHNGTAFFSGTGTWLNTTTQSNYIISGDAGDGQKHFTIADPTTNISPYSYIANLSSGSKSNIKISYINFGTVNIPGTRLKAMDMRAITGLEIDHTYVKIGGSNPDCWMYLETSTSGYDKNLIHDNEIYLVRGSSGVGADGIKGGANTSVYNNTFVGYFVAGFAGTQHQDGLQPLAGAYLKIYNNKFVNIANYPIFLDAYYGDFSHVQIYNNLIVLTDSVLVSSAPPQGIAAGPDGGAFNQLGRWPSFTDVAIMNNTVVDYGRHNCINLRNNARQASVFTNCIVANNICWHGNGFGIEAGITNVDNINTSSGKHFVSYSYLSSLNDLHLLSTDTTFKDQGTDESAYFATDKDGVSRPQGSAWDIGAYEY